MRKRLIYRCDDVGYTPAYDMGIFDVIDAGIGGSADVMFDASHAREALEMIKERPWISVGWHRHLWESPVLAPEEVPSLVNEQGRFKWGHRKRNLMLEATYEDAYKEFEAEMALCYETLGKYPDVASGVTDDIPLEKAFKDVCDKYHITYNFFTRPKQRPRMQGESEELYAKEQARQAKTFDEKYADLHIISLPIHNDYGYAVEYYKYYNPLEIMTKMEWSDKEEIYFYGWHPGFLDGHILKESTSCIHRVREYNDALSDEYKNWIIENHVELINFRDALYGTNEFQDHLKAIDSPLYIGNMK